MGRLKDAVAPPRTPLVDSAAQKLRTDGSDGKVARHNRLPAGNAGRLLFWLAMSLVAVAAALLFGRYPRPGFIAPGVLAVDPMAARVVLLVRLPRVIAALLLGATLGASGAAMQYIFANPLVDAGFLGVSHGASFGAALALLLGGSGLAVSGSAFGFAVLALAMSVGVSSRIRFGGAVLRLILSGLAVSAFFSALVSMLKFGADPLSTLPEITYWLMGGLSGASWQRLMLAAPVAVLSVGVLVMLRWRVTLLSLDEATATSLGARPAVERTLVLAMAAAGVAAVTALSGVVGWVGLIVPHLARLALPGDEGSTIPGAALYGAMFVLLADALSRGLFPAELPLGVTTSLLGTVVFLGLIASRRMSVERG